MSGKVDPNGILEAIKDAEGCSTSRQPLAFSVRIALDLLPIRTSNRNSDDLNRHDNPDWIMVRERRNPHVGRLFNMLDMELDFQK